MNKKEEKKGEEKKVIYAKDEIEFLKQKAKDRGMNLKDFIKERSLNSNVIIILNE